MSDHPQRLSRPVRQSHPSADAPTPSYSRRFSYVHSGQSHVFDEATSGFGAPSTAPAAAADQATSSKRAPAAFDADGPAPKRRERTSTDESPEDSNAQAAASQPAMPGARHNLTVQVFHERDSPMAAASTNPVNTMSTNAINPVNGGGSAGSSDAAAAPASAMTPASSGPNQPASSSPTASPRSSASPDSSEMEDNSPGHEISPASTTPGTGPPSTQVYTPLPVGDLEGEQTTNTHTGANIQGAHANIQGANHINGLNANMGALGANMGALNSGVPLNGPLNVPPNVPPNLVSSNGALNPTFIGESSPRSSTPRPPYLPQSVTIHDQASREHSNALGHLFTQTPPASHRYTLFNSSRLCDRSTMSASYGELERASRFDVSGSSPPELSSIVSQYLDAPSVLAASEVCRAWYRSIDGDEAVWQMLAEADCSHPTDKDVETARVERWGYTGWATSRNWPSEPPTNAFGRPVNVHKAVYRRLVSIHENWMRPDVEPRRRVIQCPDREVITCLDFSDDIIIASTEGMRHLNVYDTQSCRSSHQFSDHDGGVWASKRVGTNTIVTGSTDHTVRVWSSSKGRCTHVFRGHHATVRCLDVVMPQPGSAYDFPLISTGSRDTTMRMWRSPGEDDDDYDSKVAFVDQENPYFVGESRGHQESVRAVSGYGDVAVSGSYDFRVRVWDSATRKCRHELVGHENKVYAAIIDPERNRCISASMDTYIIIWDLATGNQSYKSHGHTGLVGLVSSRDDTLVSAAADKTSRVWNPNNGRLSHTSIGHNTAISCFVHDGRRIVSGSERHLKSWDTRTGKFSRDSSRGMELIWQVGIDRRRCVAAVSRNRCSYLEVLDFDFDPNTVEPEAESKIEIVE